MMAIYAKLKFNKGIKDNFVHSDILKLLRRKNHDDLTFIPEKYGLLFSRMI